MTDRFKDADGETNKLTDNRAAPATLKVIPSGPFAPAPSLKYYPT